MPRERNLAGLAPISLPSRATARVTPTIRPIALLWPCIVGATLAVALTLALALALAVALAPLSSRIWAGPAGSRSGGLLYKADLLCSSN